TKSADLIYRGLEITTLAQREERYDVLVSQLKAKGLGTKDIQWYLDFFRYGMPPHGGWGLGGARFIMKLLGIEHIRDAMFIYRGVNNLNP
ncbi:MAG: aspartate--tRNA(Asn) ligase, partial [Alphaproteobacteria bacterium]|nr:aspartate--tRNA(Asn) ligase [Alphaproteobacteria bacterium]